MLKSIQGQLLFIVFLLVAVSFLVSGAINAYFVSASFEDHIRRDNLVFAEALSKNVYAFVHNAYNIASGLARDNDVREMIPEKQRELFADNAARFPFFNNLYSTSVADGMQIARAYGPNASRRNRYWFMQMKERPSPWIYTNYTRSGDIAVAGIFTPIFDKNGDYAAIMGADLKLGYIQEFVERFTERPGSFAYVLDETGVVLAHHDKIQFQQRYNYITRTKAVVVKDAQGNTMVSGDGGDQLTEAAPIDIPDALHDIALKGLAGESGAVEYRDLNGATMIGAYYPVNIPDIPSRWLVITVQNKDIALAMVHDVTRKNAAVAALILAIAFFAVYRFISRVVVRPINELAAGAEEIGRGDLTKRLHISNTAELGKLARAYNTMTENLQQRSLERERAQAALEASEEKFAKAFRHYADVIGIIRLADRKIIEVNEAFYDIFGYQPDEVIGYTTVEIGLLPGNRETVRIIAAAYSALTAGKALRNVEIGWQTKNGMIRSGLWSAEAIEINGEPCSIFAWKDISELKRAQQELREAQTQLELKVEMRTQELTALNQELRASNEELSHTLDRLKQTQDQLVRSEKMAALGGLVAGVAHEINTPVGVSLTAATFLGNTSKSLKELYMETNPNQQQLMDYVDDCLEATNIIQVNLSRAARLISSFKQVSADQSSEAKRAFNVKIYLEEILLSLHPNYKKTKHRIIAECDDNLEVDGFPGALSQIVTNLLMNSLAHAYDSHDEGNIRIAVRKENNCLIIDYADDGKGMAKNVREKIFDPFFTTKRGDGGTGLGLYIVYNIVTQQFGGSISCDSEIGQGTKFHIRIPF